MNACDALRMASSLDNVQTTCIFVRTTREARTINGWVLPKGTHLLTYPNIAEKWGGLVTRDIDPDGTVWMPHGVGEGVRRVVNELLRDCAGREIRIGTSRGDILRLAVMELAPVKETGPVRVIRPFDREPGERVFVVPERLPEDEGFIGQDVMYRPKFVDDGL